MDVDTPTPVTQSHEEARTKVQRIQFSGGPSIANVVHEPIDEVSNKPTKNLLISSKTTAHLYRDINSGRRLVPIGPPVEKRLGFMNTEGSSAVAAQNPSSLLDRTESLTTSSIGQQGSTRQNQCLPIDQSFERDPLRGSTDQPNSRTIRIRLTRKKPSMPSNQTRELPQPRQSQLNQRHSLQPQGPKRHMNISIKPKNKHNMSNLGEILTSLLNSLQGALPKGHVVHHQRSEASSSESEPEPDESRLNVLQKVCQTDSETAELLARPDAIPGPSARSRSSTDVQRHSRHVSQQETLDNLATNSQMPSTSRATSNMSNILETAGTYRNLSGAPERFNSVRNSATSVSLANAPVEVPVIGERREDSKTHDSKSGNSEEILKGSKIHGSRSGNNEQRLEISTTHNGSRSINNEEIFEGSTTHGSRSGNNEERLEGSTTHSSSSGKKKHKTIWRFVLPPEYDRNDTRWTLKYRYNLPGLVEITPGSRVYISYGNLKYCLLESKDCKPLASRLLAKVFNRNALSVCLTLAERAQTPDNVDSSRPELDDHACTVLLNFVIEHGLQRGWNTDLRPILNTLDSIMKEIRFRYGVMVQVN